MPYDTDKIREKLRAVVRGYKSAPEMRTREFVAQQLELMTQPDANPVLMLLEVIAELTERVRALEEKAKQ